MVIVTNKNSIMSHSYCFNFMSENLKDRSGPGDRYTGKFYSDLSGTI